MTKVWETFGKQTPHILTAPWAWQVSSHLSLGCGLRWSLFSLCVECIRLGRDTQQLPSDFCHWAPRRRSCPLGAPRNAPLAAGLSSVALAGAGSFPDCASLRRFMGGLQRWSFVINSFKVIFLQCPPELGTLLLTNSSVEVPYPQIADWDPDFLAGFLRPFMIWPPRLALWTGFPIRRPHAGLNALLLLSGLFFFFFLHHSLYIFIWWVIFCLFSFFFFWLGLSIYVSTPEINCWKPFDLKIIHHDIVNKEF